MKSVTVSHHNNSVPLIEMYFNEQLLSKGSSFFYRYEGEIYLITNWHNVTGRNSLTHAALNSQGALPNKIQVTFGFKEPYHDMDKTGKLHATVCHRRTKLNLYNSNGEPFWLEHEKGSEIDVVALRMNIEKKDHDDFICVNDNTHKYNDPKAGDDVVILGYPEGITVNKTLPIWKRGSLASEIVCDINGLPKFYIDTMSCQGMSGAPVFSKNDVIRGTIEGLKTTNETVFHFLGCYSGRLSSKNTGAQLGIVWKENAILEILKHKIPGTSSDKLQAKEYKGNETRYHDLWN